MELIVKLTVEEHQVLNDIVKQIETASLLLDKELSVDRIKQYYIQVRNNLMRLEHEYKELLGNEIRQLTEPDIEKLIEDVRDRLMQGY